VSDGANPLRQALWPLGLAYGAAAALRNWLFDGRLRAVHRLGAPVVSVGNLTAGGTGKTPLVLWLCELAHRHGRRPGVLARGYARAPGAALNDEGAMLQQRLPWLLQEQDPDRVAAGRRLLARGADFVVLDDGFQHRRLHRDVDVVCLDAVLPFGNGACLPAGDLREFRTGLRRADVVVWTRADRLPQDALALRTARVRELACDGDLPVFAAVHEPIEVVERPGGAVHGLDRLHGRRAVLLSAIARPASFRATCEELGVAVVAERRHRDHHRFTSAEVDAAQAAARAAGAELVTTEKDDVRLPATAPARLVLRIGLRFLGPAPAPSQVGIR
jgi:tetraacyldisaccharide 4'-kinase